MYSSYILSGDNDDDTGSDFQFDQVKNIHHRKSPSLKKDEESKPVDGYEADTDKLTKRRGSVKDLAARFEKREVVWKHRFGNSKKCHISEIDKIQHTIRYYRFESDSTICLEFLFFFLPIINSWLVKMAH